MDNINPNIYKSEDINIARFIEGNRADFNEEFPELALPIEWIYKINRGFVFAYPWIYKHYLREGVEWTDGDDSAWYNWLLYRIDEELREQPMEANMKTTTQNFDKAFKKVYQKYKTAVIEYRDMPFDYATNLISPDIKANFLREQGLQVEENKGRYYVKEDISMIDGLTWFSNWEQ